MNDWPRPPMKPAGAIGVFLLAMVLVVLELCGCGAVARNADALTVEGYAAVLRQDEAATVLVELAEEARQDGDLETCQHALAPALEIEARGWRQWARGLYLAGLTYPDATTGQLPPDGTEQPDPGPPAPARDAAALCAGQQPLEYLGPPRQPG